MSQHALCIQIATKRVRLLKADFHMIAEARFSIWSPRITRSQNKYPAIRSNHMETTNAEIPWSSDRIEYRRCRARFSFDRWDDLIAAIVYAVTFLCIVDIF